jgi:hypothetical protein
MNSLNTNGLTTGFVTKGQQKAICKVEVAAYDF